ncbi:endo-1,4-beta-xylanase [Acetobacteraceae bacterium H6797]|nr:endo-1,4-beta-xylanase [Acetobacteraceae bacterium H6797]
MALTKSPSTALARAAEDGLAGVAKKRGITYGAALLAENLADENYKRALDREAALLMPIWEGKWGAIEPQEAVLNTGPLKQIIDWGAAEGKAVRGHTLIWHESLPEWVTKGLKGGRNAGISIMASHMDRVLGFTKPFIRDWDVVNEPIADPPGSDTPQSGPGDLRRTPWLEAMGPDYIQQAFIMARQRDATLRLTLNEYGIEEDTPAAEEKRRRLLSLVRELVMKSTPIDAVGIQAHLQLSNPFRPEPLQRFISALQGTGLQVLVTELDIRETWNAPQDIAARDALVAERAYAFASTAVEAGVKTFLTWGISDRYTWLNDTPGVAMPSGRKHRGLPLGEDLSRKPMWQALARAFSGGS